MGFKLELGPEPRTAGSFFSFPCEKTEDTLVFVSWVLGMQNTFSNGRKFFFPSTPPPFCNGGSVPRTGHKSLFTPALSSTIKPAVAQRPP